MTELLFWAKVNSSFAAMALGTAMVADNSSWHTSLAGIIAILSGIGNGYSIFKKG